MKTGKAEGESKELDLTVLGANLNLGWQQGTKEKVTTDAAGNMTESEVTGTQGLGGSFGVGAAPSATPRPAQIERDGKGNVQLDLTKEKTSTSLKKPVKKLPFMGNDEPEGTDKKKPTGLLSDAAGGGAADDGIEQDLAELRVSRVDLVKIAAIAKDDVNRWTAAAAISLKSYEPWRELGRKIAGGAFDPGAVADALARFVRGDKSKRMQILDRLLRPSGDTSMAARIQFSGGRAEAAEALHRPGHRCLRSADRGQGEERRPGRGRQRGAEAHRPDRQALRRPLGLQSLREAAQRAGGDLSAINERKTVVLAARGRNAGKQSDADELEALKSEYGRLRKDCVHYEVMEESPLKEVLELIDGRKEIRALEFADAVEPIRRAQRPLRDLEARHRESLGARQEDRPAGERPRPLPAGPGPLREAEEGLPALTSPAGRPVPGPFSAQNL